MKLIGITGLARSGKTTVATLLQEYITNYIKQNKIESNNWKTIAFADPIKEMLFPLGLSLEDIEDYKSIKHPHFGVTSRKLMQTLGTQWGRKLDENFWIKVIHNRISQTNNNYIISDVRFNNEANYIKENNGIIINISGRGGIALIHESELGIRRNLIDYHLDNSGDMLDLVFNINQLIKTNDIQNLIN